MVMRKMYVISIVPNKVGKQVHLVLARCLFRMFEFLRAEECVQAGSNGGLETIFRS